ncbi:MAG TPA: hypothetical protein VGL71_08040 [Urbifossiella sp.]|jgi:hypothetical protein
MIRFLRIALALALTLPLYAAEPCVSGVPVGKRPTPYSFLIATGPQRGQQTCYICEQHEGGKPAAIVFAKTLTDPLGKLMAKLEAARPAKNDPGFKTWLTHTTSIADLDGLAKWAQDRGLKGVPVGAFEDADGPPAYKLNKDADVTVILFVKEKVVANFAFRTGELNDAAIDKVIKSMPKLFEGK